jgi:hypothetical protein
MNTISISRRKFAQLLGAGDCPDFYRLTLVFSRDYATAHFFTVSHVRVVTFLPKVFSINVMNAGPRGPGT